MKTILLLLLPIISFGQKITLNSSCSYFGEKLPASLSVSYSDYEAQNGLRKIMDAAGLPTNFTLVTGNIPNACATLKYNPTTKTQERFIIYNPLFMERIKSSTNDWAALSILAHEVGHHLSGHSLMSGGSRPDLELEADKFSGFILQKLGATIEQATTAINLLTNNFTSTTHPSKSSRIIAIQQGWNNAGSTNQSVQKPTKVGIYKIVNGVTLGNNELYWVKKSDNSLELICEGYKFSSSEFTLFNPCSNGNLVVYMNDYGNYFTLENFYSNPVNATLRYIAKPTCSGICNKQHTVIKVATGYYVLNKGVQVQVITANARNDIDFGTVYHYQLTDGSTILVTKYDYDKAQYCEPIFILSD